MATLRRTQPPHGKMNVFSSTKGEQHAIPCGPQVNGYFDLCTYFCHYVGLQMHSQKEHTTQIYLPYDAIMMALDSTRLLYYACLCSLPADVPSQNTLFRCRCASSSYTISRNGESDDCDKACTGDNSAECGGSHAVSTWEI